MHLKSKKLIAVFLVMILSFQLAGCFGMTALSGKPSDVISTLEDSIHTLDKDAILGITNIEKGSSRYKEYEEIFDLSNYPDDAVRCYKAVAEKIKIDFDETKIETASGLAKVHITFSMPNWRAVFGDISFKDIDTVISALDKSETQNVDMTLRLINSKDGLKVKNADELMEIFEFLGYEIALLDEDRFNPSHDNPQPSETEPSETEPSETEPTEPAPSETEPSKPSETEPSDTKPSETEPTTPEPTTPRKKGTSEDLAAAYAAYVKILSRNKSEIEWYEKNANPASCILSDINGDDIPELIFFLKGATGENLSSYCVYSYNPAARNAKMILVEALPDPAGETSEYFVLKTKDNKILSYKGYLNETGAISSYSIYENNDPAKFVDFTGTLFGTVMDLGIQNKTVAICSITGVDKYKERTTVPLDEFRRVEKKLLDSAVEIYSYSFRKSLNSVPCSVLDGKKLAGTTYAEMMKKISG